MNLKCKAKKAQKFIAIVVEIKYEQKKIVIN